MKRIFVLVALILVSCASAKRAEYIESSKEYKDMHEALTYYLIAASAPCARLNNLSDEDGAIAQLVKGYERYIDEQIDDRISRDVRALLLENKKMLNILFNRKETDELHVDGRLKKIEILFCLEEQRQRKRRIYEALADYGRPEIEYRIKEDMQRPEAFIEIQITFSPDEIPENKEQERLSCLFKVDRRLHLVKNKKWQVVSSE